MKRRIISILLAICMLLSALCMLPACTEDAAPSASPTATVNPTSKPTPKPTPTPTPTPTHKAESSLSSSGQQQQTIYYATQPISGYPLSMTVYVSNSGGKIHTNPHFSGMKYYSTMTYGQACQYGYIHCKNCF